MLAENARYFAYYLRILALKLLIILYDMGRSVYTLLVCLFVSNFNVKMAEPIGPTFIVGPHVTPKKVYDNRIFQKFLKIHEIYFFKSAKFYNVYKENMFTIKIEYGREAL